MVVEIHLSKRWLKTMFHYAIALSKQSTDLRTRRQFRLVRLVVPSTVPSTGVWKAFERYHQFRHLNSAFYVFTRATWFTRVLRHAWLLCWHLCIRCGTRFARPKPPLTPWLSFTSARFEKTCGHELLGNCKSNRQCSFSHVSISATTVSSCFDRANSEAHSRRQTAHASHTMISHQQTVIAHCLHSPKPSGFPCANTSNCTRRWTLLDSISQSASYCSWVRPGKFTKLWKNKLLCSLLPPNWPPHFHTSPAGQISCHGRFSWWSFAFPPQKMFALEKSCVITTRYQGFAWCWISFFCQQQKKLLVVQNSHVLIADLIHCFNDFTRRIFHWYLIMLNFDKLPRIDEWFWTLRQKQQHPIESAHHYSLSPDSTKRVEIHDLTLRTILLCQIFGLRSMNSWRTMNPSEFFTNVPKILWLLKSATFGRASRFRNVCMLLIVSCELYFTWVSVDRLESHVCHFDCILIDRCAILLLRWRPCVKAVMVSPNLLVRCMTQLIQRPRATV